MKTSSSIARRVLLALAAAGAIAGALGACASNSAGHATDLGGGGDDGGQGFDMGAAGDFGAQSIQVSLSTPAPWQSLVATSAQFQFLTMLPGGGTPQLLEPYVEVTPRPAGAPDGGTMPLSGAFNWSSTGPSAYLLNFLPAALTDGTDYVVTIMNPASALGPPLLKTGISTGPKPRVVHVTFKVTAHANAVSALVTFSEPMDPSPIDSSSIPNKLVITAGGSAVASTVSEPAGATDHLNFQLDVSSPHGLATPLQVVVKTGAMAMSSVPLVPASWDSPTVNANNDFYWQPPGLPASLDNATTDTLVEFTPTLN